MNIWEAVFVRESPSISEPPVTQLVSAASLRKASVKAEKWVVESKQNGLVLWSITRRDDVVI